MSFAGEVRRELRECVGKQLHCKKAELVGIYEGCRRYRPRDIVASEKDCRIFSESLTIQKKCISLVRKAYQIEATVSHMAGVAYVDIGDDERIYADICDDHLLDLECCVRAYLRGWFLAAGTVTDPEGRYDLELITDSADYADRLVDILNSYELAPRTTRRKGLYVVYLREAQKIVDFLGLVGAHGSLMKFENARIVKEVRGNINRRVNCENANIKKTVSASVKQIEDIEYLRETVGFDELPDSLSRIAGLRLEYPESSLQELGAMLDPPIGKSGVNHRLRKISEMADTLRRGGSIG